MVHHMFQADERLAITVTNVPGLKLTIQCRRSDYLVAAELTNFEVALMA